MEFVSHIFLNKDKSCFMCSTLIKCYLSAIEALRIEQGFLGVKCYALFNVFSILCCKENICLLYIHESHFIDQFNDVFIVIMYKLKSG